MKYHVTVDFDVEANSIGEVEKFFDNLQKTTPQILDSDITDGPEVSEEIEEDEEAEVE